MTIALNPGIASGSGATLAGGAIAGPVLPVAPPKIGDGVGVAGLVLEGLVGVVGWTTGTADWFTGLFDIGYSFWLFRLNSVNRFIEQRVELGANGGESNPSQRLNSR